MFSHGTGLKYILVAVPDQHEGASYSQRAAWVMMYLYFKQLGVTLPNCTDKSVVFCWRILKESYK